MASGCAPRTAKTGQGAAAAAVAFVAGGGIALALVLAYTVLGIALRIPGLMTFC